MGRRSVVSFWPAIAVLLVCIGCKEGDIASFEQDQKTIVNINIIPQAMTTNAAIHFNAIIEPLPKVPFICSWNFKDSSIEQYSQPGDMQVHYFNRPGTYLVRLLILDAYTFDTIGSVERPIDIIEEVNSPIYSTLQLMKRVFVLFRAKKQYTFSQEYQMIETERLNYSSTSWLTIRGRTGVYQSSSTYNDYRNNSYSEAGGQTELLFRSDYFLDSLFLTSSTQTSGSNSAGKYWSSYTHTSLTIHTLPLVSLTADSIVFEASGEAVKEYCQMVDSYSTWDNGANNGSSYQLQSIDWQNPTVIPKLRVVLMK